MTRCAAEQFTTVSGFVRDKIAIDIPPHDPTAGQLEITVSPSLVGDLADTLGYLVEYPYGCVEQTMSRFLPAIKVSQILKQHGVKHPELEKKLPGVAAAGIKRLIELQHGDGSWGWLGTTNASASCPPTRSTACSRRRRPGTPSMRNRSRRERSAEEVHRRLRRQRHDRPRLLPSVHSHRVTLSATLRWKWIEDHAKENKFSDSALALALEWRCAAKSPSWRSDSPRRWARAKLEDGTAHWTTAGFSRWGDDRFEVTAAASRLLVAYDSNDPLVEKALAFFAATKRGNRWNSTKDTAMILFAMCDYLAKAKVGEPMPGDLEITVNGRSHAMKLDGAFAKTLVIPASELKAGPTELRMATQMKGAMVRAVFRHWKSGRDIEPAAHRPRRRADLFARRREGRVDSRAEVRRFGPARQLHPERSRHENRELPACAVPACREPEAERLRGDCEGRQAVRKARGMVLQPREDRDTKVSFLYEYAGDVARDHCVFLAELAGEFVVAPASAELMYSPLVRGHSGAFVLCVTD